jgi:hypothetical protein
MKRGMVTARIPNPHHGEEIDPSLLDTILKRLVSVEKNGSQ